MTSNEPNLSSLTFLDSDVRNGIWLTLRDDPHASVTDPHHVLTFGPVGSKDRMAYAYRRVVDGQVEARIVAGCWGGTLTEFRHRLDAVYGYKGSNPNDAHYNVYSAFVQVVGARQNQWRDEYEPPKPKARVVNLYGEWHGYLDCAKTRKNSTGLVVRFRDAPGFDAKAEAEAWLARQLADDETTDDEPERCSYVDSRGYQCRMDDGHATDVREHYCTPLFDVQCAYGGCIHRPHFGAHLLADGTEVSA